MRLAGHALSQTFPDMPADQYNELVADIRANGQRDPGVLFEGEILDGWHRYRACCELGADFEADEFSGDYAGAKLLVLSRNLARKHLTASQRAQARVDVAESRPRGNLSQAHDSASKTSKSVPGTDLLPPPTSKQLAKEAGVSVAMIEKAKAVKKAGLSKPVRDGKVSVKRAVELSKMAPAAREKALAEAPAKPAKQAPKKAAKKGAPAKPETSAVEKLKARIAELEAENKALRDEMEQVRDGAKEAVEAFEVSQIAIAGKTEQELLKMREHARLLTIARDEQMNRCNELIREVKSLRRRLGGK